MCINEIWRNDDDEKVRVTFRFVIQFHKQTDPDREIDKHPSAPLSVCQYTIREYPKNYPVLST